MQVYSLLLAMLFLVNCVCGLPTPFSKRSLTKREGDVKICDLSVKNSSYAKKCKAKSGYVYSDPNPQNVDGTLAQTTGNWQGNKGTPAGSRGFECDHLVEAQWLGSRMLAKFGGSGPAQGSALCDRMQLDQAKKLRAVLNGPMNMIGVPTGVNQLKKHVTREPGWESWIKTQYSPFNFNKARGGLVSYMKDNRHIATDVADQLYDVFTEYDPVSFPASEKQSWATKLGLDYDKSIGVLSSKKLIDEIYGVCEANGSINPQGDPKKRPADPDPEDAQPNKKAKTTPSQPRSLWHSTLSWARAIVTGKPVASAASKPESTDGVDYECVRKGYAPDAKLSSSMLSSSTSSASSAARSTSLTRTADPTSTDSLSSASSLTSGSSSTRTQPRPLAAQHTAFASDADEGPPASLHATATAQAALRPSSAPFYASSDAPSPLHSVSRPALQPAGLLPSPTGQPGLVRPPARASAPPPAALLPRPSSATLAPRPASNTALRPSAAMPTRRPILPAASKPPSGGRKAGRIHL